MSALPQVSGALSHAMTGQDLFVVALVALALVALVVVVAVLSGDADKRKDARRVLGALVRWRG